MLELSFFSGDFDQTNDNYIININAAVSAYEKNRNLLLNVCVTIEIE